MLFCGIPVLCMEYAIGQLTQKGQAAFANFCPILKGRFEFVLNRLIDWFAFQDSSYLVFVRASSSSSSTRPSTVGPSSTCSSHCSTLLPGPNVKMFGIPSIVLSMAHFPTPHSSSWKSTKTIFLTTNNTCWAQVWSERPLRLRRPVWPLWRPDWHHSAIWHGINWMSAAWQLCNHCTTKAIHLPRVRWERCLRKAFSSNWSMATFPDSTVSTWMPFQMCKISATCRI